MSVFFRLFLGLPILLVFFLAIDFCIQRYIGEGLYEEAQTHRGLESLLLIKRAVNIAPDNYRYIRERANIEKKLKRDLSHEWALKKAISVRPSWPYSWQALARHYAKQNNFSREFDYALTRSSLLGHDSSYLTWQRVELGLGIMNKGISEHAHNILKHDIERAFQSNKGKLLGYALVTEQYDVICYKDVVEFDKKMEEWCKGANWVSSVCKNRADLPGPLQNKCNVTMRHWWRQVWKKFRLLPEPRHKTING